MRKLNSRGIAAAVAAAGLALAVAATPARAIPIAGDYSAIDITIAPALSAAGVTLSALGDLELFTASFLVITHAVIPVTGGDVDLPTSFLGTIEHSGSGLRLSFLGIDLDFNNLVFNTITGQVFSDFVSPIGSATTDIFDILPCDSGPPGTCATIPGGAVGPSSLRLTFSANGAAVVAASFGISGLAGVQFGEADTHLRAVPEPGTALLVGSALLGLAALRRGRRA